MTAAFRTTRRVEFADTDMAGMMHFSNFFRYMEAAEVEFLRARGISVVAMDWEGQKLTFPRVSASCDYLQPARFGDVLEIAVTIAKVGRTSVTYGFEFFRDGAAMARGSITAVCCSIGAELHLEPFEIPSALREKLK